LRFCILATDILTGRQISNRWTGSSHYAALAVASGGFTSHIDVFFIPRDNIFQN